MRDFSAHIKYENGKRIIQSCQAHSDGTAEYAKAALTNVGLGEVAYLSGMLHDCGKFTREYQDYIEKAASGINVRKGSVNHSFSGVRYVLENYHDHNKDAVYVLTSEIVSYAIGAHHGLFDCVNENHESGFEHRLTKEGISYKEAVENYFDVYKTKTEIDSIFRRAVREVNTVLNRIQSSIQEDENGLNGDNNHAVAELNFYIGFLVRLVLSAVVEGDRKDTSEFFIGLKKAEAEVSDELWRKTLVHVEEKLSQLNGISHIDKARTQLSNMCKQAALKEPGIYRLDMPTGSGKTLSALRYAVTHAERWHKKRIIFVTSLLSILDQNAAVIRDYIGNDEIILEHHSNVIRPTEGSGEYDQWEYYTESWHAPVIITTMVQFLNTLFSGKMNAVRRMHSLCESVIVIDEVQTIPTKMLSMFNSSINFLQMVCKATVILSSATQPTFEKTHYPLRKINGNLVVCSDELKEIFRRTEITIFQSCTLEESVNMIRKVLQCCNSLLIVCNKKKEAQYLFEQIGSTEADIFHLSSAMCMRHRKDALNEIRHGLDEIKKENKKGFVTRKKVICVATQVIEAGVDISFEKVIRFTAGMDSVIQSSGRCNRSGEYGDKGEVIVFSCLDENLNMLKEIKKAKMATESLLEEYKKRDSVFQGRLDSDESIDYYYRTYYRSFGDHYQDYALRDHETVYNLMSLNSNYVGISEKTNAYYLRQAFSKAGSEFEVLDSDTVDVIVPYKQGREIINDLNTEKARWNDRFVINALEEAKQYTVSMYSYQLKKLEEIGAVFEILDGRALALQSLYYDNNIGVVEEDKNNGYLEVSL